MDVEITAGYAPRVQNLAREFDRLSTPCLGCTECRGMCLALIEALTVPDMITGDRTS